MVHLENGGYDGGCDMIKNSGLGRDVTAAAAITREGDVSMTDVDSGEDG